MALLNIHWVHLNLLWHGGKHSDDTITNARARMLDKVDRSPMRVGNTYEEFWMVVPYDHL